MGPPSPPPTIDQSWAPSREKWMEKCACVIPKVETGMCTTCGLPSRTPTPPGSSQCYLCKGAANLVHCHMCGKGFHYQPHCRLHSGVHPLYHANYSMGGPICPDCVWCLCNSHNVEPTDIHAKTSTIEQQRLLAADPQPPAGSNYNPNGRSEMRSLFRLMCSKTPFPKSSCPKHLKATLELAIRQEMITVDPQGMLCRGPTPST